MGVAANKCDCYNEEIVDEKEARDWAKEIGAIFKVTSALDGTGINELFYSIGEKIFSKQNTNNNNQNYKAKNIRIDSAHISKEKEKVNKCC